MYRFNGRLHRDSGAAVLPFGPPPEDRYLHKKKLIKREATAGSFTRGLVGREMHVPERRSQLRQLVPGPDCFGHKLFCQREANTESLASGVAQRPLLKALRGGVYG
jgi:hypothetical protein